MSEDPSYSLRILSGTYKRGDPFPKHNFDCFRCFLRTLLNSNEGIKESLEGAMSKDLDREIFMYFYLCPETDLDRIVAENICRKIENEKDSKELK